MSRLITLLLTVSLLLAAPVAADTGGKIHVKSVRQFTPAKTTTVVTETSSASYTQTGDKGSYGPTSKTTYVETTPKLEVLGTQSLSEPVDNDVSLLVVCAASFALTLFAFLAGVFIGRRRTRA
jgi:hypothetical protein